MGLQLKSNRENRKPLHSKSAINIITSIKAYTNGLISLLTTLEGQVDRIIRLLLRIFSSKYIKTDLLLKNNQPKYIAHTVISFLLIDLCMESAKSVDITPEEINVIIVPLFLTIALKKFMI